MEKLRAGQNRNFPTSTHIFGEGYGPCISADLGLSSLDVMDAVVAFEEEFGVEIPVYQIIEFRTVGDIVRYFDEL